ncbi:MAG: dienelactone hydrolase family protein [Alphaproteobacteria bacterium]|nr:dienelactone hydrolase family protein [Alphaproteobacteria bacterium]
MDTLRTYTFGPASGNPPQQVVIMLHGLGADGRDLLGLAPELARALPDAVFVSPDAPFPCDMAPMGRQWFSLQEWTPEAILRGVQHAAPILHAFIDSVLAQYKLPPEKLALLGFSQGTMMSLYVGPHYKDTIGGIMGFSGALVWEDVVDDNMRKPPVCLVHGMADAIVPISAYYHAREKLTAVGFKLSGHVSPALMHSIDFDGIDAARTFLKEVLGA